VSSATCTSFSDASFRKRADSGISNTKPKIKINPNVLFNRFRRSSLLGQLHHSKTLSPTTPTSTNIPPGSRVSSQSQEMQSEKSRRIKESAESWNSN
jgi:hypothetical protein